MSWVALLGPVGPDSTRVRWKYRLRTLPTRTPGICRYPILRFMLPARQPDISTKIAILRVCWQSRWGTLEPRGGKPPPVLGRYPFRDRKGRSRTPVAKQFPKIPGARVWCRMRGFLVCAWRVGDRIFHHGRFGFMIRWRGSIYPLRRLGNGFRRYWRGFGISIPRAGLIIPWATRLHADG